MLIRFVVENFKSFKEETEFNLLTGNIRKHPNHVHHTKQGIDILPTSVIYGGNASGKSNLVKAIFTAARVIISGTTSKNEGFNIDKFAFDDESFLKPTKFEFEFKTEKGIYAYGLVIQQFKIKEEWLYSISSNNKDKLLFKREKQEIEYGKRLKIKKEDELFLKHEARGVRSNQPFLTESYMREVVFFDDAYKWFQELIIIFPEQKNSKLSSFYNFELLTFTNSLLAVADTGISVETRKVNINKLKDEYPNIRDYIEKNYTHILKHGVGFQSKENIVYSIVFNQKTNELEAIKLITKHPKLIGGTIVFETNQESDGTQRILDLASGIYPAIYENKVVIIDEIDRSIHPLLSKKLIEIFIGKRIENKGTGQLICTTHEDLIIDMDILRPDEVWFVQKNDEGVTELYPLSDFKIRYDIDVRKGYLNGRFGAIPGLDDDRLIKKSA